MYYVYILKSLKRKWFYIGCTDKLNKRFKQHNNSRVRSTKAYLAFELIYYEAYKDKGLARKREIELKNSSQQKEILYKRLGII
jgi:putative endonuclease